MNDKVALLIKRIVAAAALATVSIIIVQMFVLITGMNEGRSIVTGPVGTLIAVVLALLWFPFVKKKMK